MIDEIPGAYKDIDEVMRAQSDLVEPLATFQPKLVKMAPAGSGLEPSGSGAAAEAAADAEIRVMM